MPAISEIKSQGNKKFPFSNTLKRKSSKGITVLAAFLEEQPKQQIILTEEITSQQCISKRIFHGVT
ncbi:hypothetical protein L0P01_15490 [Klebsiella pneumoniae]|uniref:hypothetical protein n=1 Tax=Klebsiella pneumoniae complex TaxID=3390273 RepID=UPI000E34B8DB|nr:MULTISPECIES: hypothetical protein [Klebsiella]HDS5697722.1 hypothetical protein [Klebsiella pneumoniae subsp. pneumoniae]EKW3956431.1 hypothetical protein [Klebsiella pneumoniae]ELA2295849.1 hypothetical protein [Klebsiella pneumoniae]MCG4511640.1 hypothetical protein [Klebsiella pneumoniae]MDO0723223.1 hypothetical protein [Klebsiella pneumoniae]